MAFDTNAFINNPWTNIGLGILAANKPGASFGQAVGGGGLLGLENYGRMQDRKEQAAYRKLQAEKFKMEMDRAKRQAKVEAEMQRALKEQCGGDPACEAVANDPASFMRYQEYANPQRPLGALPWWVTMGEDGTPSINPEYIAMQEGVARAGNPGLASGVTRDLQGRVIKTSEAIKHGQRLLENLKSTTNVVGAWPRVMENVAGVAGQAAEATGIPLFQWAADAAQPGSDSFSPSDYKLQARNFANAMRESIAEAGKLSDRDQFLFDSAIRLLEGATSRTQAIRATEALMAMNQQNFESAAAILESAGEYIPVQPGETPDAGGPVQITSQEQLDSLPPGTLFIAPDGETRRKK